MQNTLGLRMLLGLICAALIAAAVKLWETGVDIAQAFGGICVVAGVLAGLLAVVLEIIARDAEKNGLPW